MSIKTAAAPPRRRVRDRQRLAHLAAGMVLLAYVYAAPILGEPFTVVVRVVVVPLLVASGLALWKWPKLRARLRTRRS